MKFNIQRYGNDTVRWEIVDCDPDELGDVENLSRSLDKLRDRLRSNGSGIEHELTKPPVVERPSKHSDVLVRDQVEAVLDDTPRSTNDLIDKLPGLDYMTARAALLDLYAEGRIERHGSGGRGGYRYSRKNTTGARDG